MKKIRHFHLVLAALSALFLAACSTVPYTERSQFNIVSREQAVQMGQQAAQQVKQEQPVVTGTAQSRRVKQVGARIAEAVRENSEDYNWSFSLVDKPDTLNAFALPSGDVFIYSGLIKLMENDAQLAAVLGHEVAHVLARHGQERMSMQAAAQMGGAVGQIAGLDSPVFQQVYGTAANLGVILPYSRKHETEADKIGLILMAKAGYRPEEAIAFWKRMMAQGGGKPPEILSTHPSDKTRVRELESFLPEARKYYHGN